MIDALWIFFSECPINILIPDLVQLIVFLFLGLIYFFGIPALDIASKYYEHMIFNIIYSVSIIFILISITKMINYNSKLLALWGTNTMLLFIVHPYTNNIGHIITDKFLFGGWYFKFFISLVILHIVILIKQRYVNKGVFKYVWLYNSYSYSRIL